MNLNQSIVAQGATVVNFDSENYDTVNSYSGGDKWYHPRSDGFYEMDSMVRVYAADGSQVPSYIDLYDAAGADVVAVGPVIGAVTAANVAHFPLHIGPVYLTNEMALQIRFNAFGACTVYASGSWFCGRSLV